MAWYDNAVFYHIYPLGLTGAPRVNRYEAPVNHLVRLDPWIRHLADLGCNALYIGPLFESVGHGYETTDYRKVDSRLGTNEDLKALVAFCHSLGIRVVLDAVFNHTGRDFFAFRDLQKNREHSSFRDWYSGVDFSSDNGYHDGFRYDTWGGYELLAKLNLANPKVRAFHLDTVRFWAEEFDIDGLRLDAADVLDFGFMRELRQLANGIKPEFWLMGEVIHGEYSRWVNRDMLHSVTNYRLYKALYSSHNDRNYFELAHTVEQLLPLGNGLYSFADNHDVDRIASRLRCPAHFDPLHVLLYTLPGLPSVYYGSEFALPGKKESGSDAPLRPMLELERLVPSGRPCTLIRRLAHARQSEPALWAGSYRRLFLTTQVYAFARSLGDREALTAVNNGDSGFELSLQARGPEYRELLSGKIYRTENGTLHLHLAPAGAALLLPVSDVPYDFAPLPQPEISPIVSELNACASPTAHGENSVLPESTVDSSAMPADSPAFPADKPLEEMCVQELQQLILHKLANNGPVTDRMRKEVSENVWADSLRNWAKSFR